MNNKSYPGARACPDAIHQPEHRDAWNGQLFAKQVMPFVDMTVKGWVWYQGENNMFNAKGNSGVDVGYSCKQRELVKGWRSIWSEAASTTAPDAPFGVVTLASSGSEGGPNMGAMRLAQTAGYGVLPNLAMPNTFLAQAGDLLDAWGPDGGPCFANLASQWGCCTKGHYKANRSSPSCRAGTRGRPEICDPACAASAGTPSEGGIHPRSKMPVGQRLATAAFGLVYGGKGAITGPTVSGCQLTHSGSSLMIEFNATLLAGERVVVNPYNSSLNNAVAPPPPLPAKLLPCFNTVKRVCATHLHNYTDCRNCKNVPGAWDQLKPRCGSRPINNFHVACKSFFPAKIPLSGSLVEVLVGQDGGDGSAAFCLEPMTNQSGDYCPAWAGGSPNSFNRTAGKWVEVDITAVTDTAVSVDLGEINGTTPAAIRYSWGVFDCCNTGDRTRYVSKPCDDACPISSSPNRLPANPFMARIVDGKCSCVPPQIC